MVLSYSKRGVAKKSVNWSSVPGCSMIAVALALGDRTTADPDAGFQCDEQPFPTMQDLLLRDRRLPNVTVRAA